MHPDHSHSGQRHAEREDIAPLLRRSGIMPTLQRCRIAEVLLSRPQHLSADQILAAANESGGPVSMATVYNTVALLVKHGLIREVIVDPQRVFYDSNTVNHHHFYNEDSGEISDFPAHQTRITGIPKLPSETELSGLQVIVRVHNRKT